MIYKNSVKKAIKKVQICLKKVGTAAQVVQNVLTTFIKNSFFFFFLLASCFCVGCVEKTIQTRGKLANKACLTIFVFKK